MKLSVLAFDLAEVSYKKRALVCSSILSSSKEHNPDKIYLEIGGQ